MARGRFLLAAAAIGGLLFAHVQCRSTSKSAGALGAGSGYAALDEIIRGRSLSPDEAAAALKTFVPPGKYDDFIMVTSGGHAGSVLLYGVPSMRLLKQIPVYSPDAWQGWGQGDSGSAQVLKDGSWGPG